MPDQQRQPPRRFIFAPDMEKLGERVEAAEKAAEEARELFSEMEDDDTAQRLCWVVAACRDVKRGNLTVDQLMDECDKAMFGLESELPTPAAIATRRP